MDNFLTGEIKTETIEAIGLMEPKSTLYINSPGGDAETGLALYDLIEGMGVTTVIVGQAASAASLAWLAGEYREATPHSHLLIHSARVDVETGGSFTSYELSRILADNEAFDAKIFNLVEKYLTQEETEMFFRGEDIRLDRAQLVERGMIK